MKRSATLSILLTVVIAAVAFAASVHFKNQRDPRFADGGVVLTASGALAGLGNEDVTVILNATGSTGAPQPTTLQGPVESPRTLTPAPIAPGAPRPTPLRAVARRSSHSAT